MKKPEDRTRTPWNAKLSFLGKSAGRSHRLKKPGLPLKSQYQKLSLIISMPNRRNPQKNYLADEPPLTSLAAHSNHVASATVLVTKDIL
jgi:hypothetical protein